MLAAFKGDTAILHALAEGAHRSRVELDLRATATSGVDEGKTALDLAEDQRNHEAAAYLREVLRAPSSVAPMDEAALEEVSLVAPHTLLTDSSNVGL